MADLTAYAGAISAGVAAGTTIVLTVLTARYVRLTAALLEHSRQAARPQVFVDLELPSNLTRLVIENRGGSSAHDVSFIIEKDVPWLKWHQDKTGGLAGLQVMAHGISYLTPGRRLVFLLGSFVGVPDGESGGIAFQVSFKDDEGVAYTKTISMDLAQYSGVSTGSFIGPADRIADALRDQERTPGPGTVPSRR
jgi:hypothetical protein